MRRQTRTLSLFLVLAACAGVAMLNLSYLGIKSAQPTPLDHVQPFHGQSEPIQGLDSPQNRRENEMKSGISPFPTKSSAEPTTSETSEQVGKAFPVPKPPTAMYDSQGDTAKNTLQLQSRVAFSDASDTMAVGLIAFANATRSLLVERAVRSIRTKGRWKGWIYLITDRPERFAPLESLDERFVAIRPPAKDWEDRLPDEFKFLPMKYKEFKTLLLDYLDLDSRLKNVQRVLYLDMDIVVCNDLYKWINYQFVNVLPAKWSPESPNSFMFMFGRNRNVYHGGVMLLSREHSNGCLAQWRKFFHDFPEESRDQGLLRKMLTAGTNQTHCQIVRMKRKPSLIFPMPEDFMTPNADGPQHRCVQFFHITNTYHAMQSNATIQQEFLETILELTPEERQRNDSLALFQGTF